MFVRQQAVRNHFREESPRLPVDEQVAERGERHSCGDIAVVVARQQQDQEDDDILRRRDGRRDVGKDVLAVVHAQHGAPVGEEEVADGRVGEMDEKEDVEVDVRRHVAVHELPYERQDTEADAEDCRPDAPVHGAIELHVGADQRMVVLGHGLVHRAVNGRTEAEFRQREHTED